MSMTVLLNINSARQNRIESQKLTYKTTINKHSLQSISATNVCNNQLQADIINSMYSVNYMHRFGFG